MIRVGTGEGAHVAHPIADLAGLAGLAAREMPPPRPAGPEVTPWLLGWLAARGVAGF